MFSFRVCFGTTSDERKLDLESYMPSFKADVEVPVCNWISKSIREYLRYNLLI